MKKILIGVSWPYTNGALHIGHLAGQYIVCDVFARYHRLAGNQVVMVSGSDMHGTPVTIAAEKRGLPVEEYIEECHQAFLDIFSQLSIQFDLFTKTETKNHKDIAQNFIKVLEENGFLLRKKTNQYYDEQKKQFLADRHIEGKCPHCGYFPARGDQCDSCGHVLIPEELVDPISKLSNSTPVLKETEELYFDMSKLQTDLEKYIAGKTFWRKNTLEFTKGWLKEGMKAKPISRDIGWGIQIPIAGFTSKVIYVWFEAVMGYLSATIEWAHNHDAPTKWEDFWKDAKAEHYYFIGKDNIPFHSLFWPAQIIAYNSKYKSSKLTHALPGETLNKELNLPTNVVANMFLNIRGEKISKSKGTMILAKDLIEQFSPELVRYFFVRYAPENHDIDFEFKDIYTLNNNELVATLGNFVYRVLSYIHTKNNGVVNTLQPVSAAVQKQINETFSTVADQLEHVTFAASIQKVMELAQFGNQYFNTTAPWKETDSLKQQQALTDTVALVRALQLLFRPFIPSLSEKIATLLGAESLLEEPNSWKFTSLAPNEKYPIAAPSIPVEKLEEVS